MNRMSVVSPARAPVRLGGGGRRTVYVIAGGLWLSGGLWLLFHYFLRRMTEFGFEAHPLEAWWLRLHGAFAFATLWLVGFLSARHIVSGWASGRRRLSGLTMLGAIGVLVLTGYLLYYLGDDQARSLVSLGHWGLGLGLPALFLCHRFAFARRRTSAGKSPAAGRRDDVGWRLGRRSS